METQQTQAHCELDGYYQANACKQEQTISENKYPLTNRSFDAKENTLTVHVPQNQKINQEYNEQTDQINYS